jgi:Tol biopolymer transport system component
LVNLLQSTLESVIFASTDRRVRYTAPIHFEDPNWTPDGKALIFNQEGTLQGLVLDDGIHPIDSTVPRSTSSTLIPTAPETKINGDHGVSPDGSLMAIGNQAPDGQARIYVMPTTGGTPRRLTPNGPPYFHDWSPDGKAIPSPNSMAITSTLIQFLSRAAPKPSLRQRATWPNSPQMVSGSTSSRTAPVTCRSGACTQMGAH